MNAEETIRLALQHQQAGRFPQARALYQEVLKAQPDHPRALHLLGVLARTAGRHDIAADLIGRAVRADASVPDHHYDLGVTYAMQGRLDDAIASFRRTLDISPDHALALLELGSVYFRIGRLHEAAECYQQSLAIDPASATAHYNLGLAFFSQGRLDEAVECYREALALQPDAAETHLNLGIALSRQHRLDEAIRHLQRAIELNSDHPLAHYNLGLALFNHGRIDEAVTSYQRALALQPDAAEACMNLGNAFIAQGKPDEAIACCRKSIALKPESAEAHLTLGLALHKLGRPQEAAECYRKANALKPDFAEAYSNLANAYLDLERLDDAVQCCRKTIALEPDFAPAHYNLGLILFRMRRLDEAIVSYQAAIALKPDYVEAYSNLGTTLTCLGRVEEAMQSFSAALALNPDSDGAHSGRLFAMQYLVSTTPAASYAAHREFAARCEAPLKPQWKPHPNTRDPERRLKIGYVSADFRRHSVANFIEPVLTHHDRARVEVFCYYNSTEHDALTARLSTLPEHWFICAGLTDEQLAERIRNDGIDILVDLSGHTEGHRLLTFARKPAPVQVTYLGYPATTGLEAMDYRLCTADTDPPGQEAWHSEKLCRLPRTLWCYRPLAERAPASPTPAREHGGLTFGSMNNLAKVSPEALALWAEILRALPGARLVMTSVPEGSARSALQQRFAANGIAIERLVMHDKLPYIDYWRLLRQIDIALDPFPYAGTTTTCETLWSGVPVVTLTGQTSVARSGYALLKTVGLDELAAADAAEYVRIAVALAHDTARLARLRTELPARFDASALRDEAGLARDLELAYRDMWQRWCRPSAAPAQARRPDDIAARINLGNEHLARGRPQEAADCFDAVYALNPAVPEAHYALGMAFYQLGRLDESTTSFQRALALKPDYVEACHNLGTLYMNQARYEQAAACFEKTIALKPDAALSHYNLGLIRFRQGKLDDAVACNRRALALKPDFAKAYNNLGVALAYQGKNTEAVRCYEKALEIQPDYTHPLSSRLCSMNRLATVTPAELYAAHRQFAERCETPLKPHWRAHPNTRDPGRRLRIGYVSADFRRHSVANFMEPVLARHERARFEVFCYFNSLERDEVTVRLNALADHWIVCASLTDEQLAERIRNDGIDILVDLNGHTDGHRLLTFARKPVPVQVTYLGYPATTGLTAMDYRLCTADTDPPGAEAWHSEKLYRLPRSLWCYRPLAERAAPGPTPAAQHGRVTFGSMNTYPKISAEAFAVWMDILRAMPTARLMMTGVPEGSVRQALAERLTAHGIAPDRVVVHTRLSDREYREVLRQIDIALDPFPYNGTTTTCETLWSGIPVVTLTGQSSVARSGYALLKTIGLSELAAEDADGYARIALALAGDTARLTQLRAGLPRRFDASALRDETGFTRELEHAYRDMWQHWCRTAQEGRP